MQAVVPHCDRNGTGIVNSSHCRLDARERIVDPAWCQPHIAAIDKTQMFHRVEIRELGIVASHQDRLLAYGSYPGGILCERGEPRSRAARPAPLHSRPRSCVYGAPINVTGLVCSSSSEKSAICVVPPLGVLE